MQMYNNVSDKGRWGAEGEMSASPPPPAPTLPYIVLYNVQCSLTVGEYRLWVSNFCTGVIKCRHPHLLMHQLGTL
jgi:hypothetical protein